jgi:two-component sensor histidine kinase/tetratricopeptide (TPR) repeat protein
MFKALALLGALSLLFVNAYGEYLGPFTSRDTAPILLKFKNSIPDTNRVGLLLQLSDQYFYRAGRTARELDSALFYTNAAQKLAISLRFEKALAMVSFQHAAIFPLINLRSKGQDAIVNAVRMFARQQDFAMLGESYYRQASYISLSESEIQEKVKYLDLALAAFRKAKLVVKEAAVLQALGELYFSDGRNELALPLLKKSLQAYQAAKYERLMGIYDLLGTLYSEMGAPYEGIKYGMLALRRAQVLGDTSLDVATVYNRIGMSHHDLHEYAKAIENYLSALAIAEKYKDVASIHIITTNLANSYLSRKEYRQALLTLNKLEKNYPAWDMDSQFWIARIYVGIFRELRQYDKAARYVNEIAAMADRPSPSPEFSEKLYSLLADFYLETGSYLKAAKYVRLHGLLAEKRKYTQMKVMNMLWQSKLDSVNHDYLSALSHYQQYSYLKDSLFNEAKSREINQLEIVYEIEKKEENIASLQKESVLHRNMLSQAALVQNITYVSISLLLIVIGLLIYGYRLVKRNNKVLATRQDEINNKNLSLGRLLIEKEWLVREIHHRVKNNLHMIVGLLESQSEFLQGDEAKLALSESEHRIQSMSMIHQRLYQTDNLTSIEISPYIHELIEYLKDCFKSTSPITFKLDIERLQMNISHSIPLGLILNEAIINSLKYAFPDGRAGTIHVVFKQISPQNFILAVSDDGVGLDPDFDAENINSFGLTLIKGLSEDLEGELIIKNSGGTTIQIGFEYVPEENDVARDVYV